MSYAVSASRSAATSSWVAMSCGWAELQFLFGALSPWDRGRPLGLATAAGLSGSSRRPSRPCCWPEGTVEVFDRDAHAPKEHANWLTLFGGARGVLSRILQDWILSAVQCVFVWFLAVFALTEMSTTPQPRRPSSPRLIICQTVLRRWTSTASLRSVE